MHNPLRSLSGSFVDVSTFYPSSVWDTKGKDDILHGAETFDITFTS